ncbi:hypothetical protein [Cellulomonas alba]|uniref:Excreted virulence factor EspC, type VII ESX diderm n=1 Tax=Cellulomonas alba TaxID=3053467 RepID=A0ABT7SG53_9CELL|nr:hypothetical protein [Cellulomonas alba]MDM7855106.1 hypothetical protein [Cellulomonas alba]
MTDLQLDTAQLQEAGRTLRTVATEFHDANARSDSVAGAVGHDGLRDAIHDFAHGWDDTRADMVDAIAGLADACQGIGDGFEKIDTDFAAALRGDA